MTEFAVFVRHDSMGTWLAIRDVADCQQVAHSVYAHIHGMGNLNFPSACLADYIDLLQEELERGIGKAMLIAAGKPAIRDEWRAESTMFRVEVTTRNR